MTGKPLVSVLLPVYNGERHLGDAMDSVLRQTYPRFELIAIDDGSTDATWDMLQHYAARDQRVASLRNGRNIGVARSLNRGLAVAQGEYIARQDADDVSSLERLRKQVEFMTANPDIGLLGSSAENIGEEGEHRGYLVAQSNSVLLEWLLSFCNPFVHSSTIYRQSLIREVGMYSTRFPHAEDYELWCRISGRARVANLPEILLQRRIGADRVSTIHCQLQEETVTRIVRGRLAGLLKGGVTSGLARNVRRMIRGLPQVSSVHIREVGTLIERLYRHYVVLYSGARDIRKLIRRDAASKLYVLAGQNVRVFPTASLWAAIRAERLDPRIPRLQTARALRRAPAWRAGTLSTDH